MFNKYQIAKFFIVLLFFSSPGLAESKTVEPIIDMVVATVDGEPITLGELRRYVASTGKADSDYLSPSSPDIKQYLKDFIAGKLFEKEAQELGVSAGDEEIDAYVEEVRKQNGVDSIKAFATLLKEKGLTLEDYKNEVKTDILRAKVTSAKIRSKINILDEDIQRYLEQHPEFKPVAGEIHLEQAFYPIDEVDQANKVVAAGRNGSDLSSIAGSAYQDLGYVNPRDLLPDLARVVEKLEIGKISDLITTQNGLYILLVSAKQEDSQVLDPKLNEKLREQLFNAKVNEKLNEYLNQELPQKYDVEVKL